MKLKKILLVIVVVTSGIFIFNIDCLSSSACFRVLDVDDSHSLIAEDGIVYFESKNSKYGFFGSSPAVISKANADDCIISYYGSMDKLKSLNLSDLVSYSSGDYKEYPTYPFNIKLEPMISSYGYFHIMEKNKNNERSMRQVFIFIQDEKFCNCIYFF